MSFEPGRKLLLLYQGENHWHERILVERCPPRTFKRIVGHEPQLTMDSVWWILTPEGDVYPEELGKPVVEGVATVSDAGNSSYVERPTRGAPDLRTRHSFDAHRRAGPPTPLLFSRVRRQCKEENDKDNNGSLGVLKDIYAFQDQQLQIGHGLWDIIRQEEENSKQGYRHVLLSKQLEDTLRTLQDERERREFEVEDRGRRHEAERQEREVRWCSAKECLQAELANLRSEMRLAHKRADKAECALRKLVGPRSQRVIEIGPRNMDLGLLPV